MKPLIIILSGNQAGEKIEINPQEAFVFGRDGSCNVSLPERRVSRKHAVIQWDEEQKAFVIQDLGSLNGTFVNGEHIPGPKVLHDQDRIQIGSFLFEFSASEMTAAAPPPADRLSSVLRSTSPSEPPRFEAPTGTDGSSISGKLSDVPLSDLLQMLSSTKKGGRLVIAPSKKELSPQPSKDTCSIYLRAGEVVGASTQDLDGVDAFYKILALTHGYFSLYPVSFEISNPIETPLEALLLEGFRRLDEEKTATIQLDPETRFEVKPDEPLSELDPDELRIFQIAWKKKKLKEIWAMSHLDPSQTDAVIRKLLRNGYLSKVKA